MFPKLTEAQLARVSRLGKRRPVKAGEVLFSQGDEHVHFYVVLSGRDGDHLSSAAGIPT